MAREGEGTGLTARGGGGWGQSLRGGKGARRQRAGGQSRGGSKGRGARPPAAKGSGCKGGGQSLCGGKGRDGGGRGGATAPRRQKLWGPIAPRQPKAGAAAAGANRSAPGQSLSNGKGRGPIAPRRQRAGLFGRQHDCSLVNVFFWSLCSKIFALQCDGSLCSVVFPFQRGVSLFPPGTPKNFGSSWEFQGNPHQIFETIALRFVTPRLVQSS